MKGTRLLLFCILAATIIGSGVLVITSYTGRGAKNTYDLVATRSATPEQIDTDAAAMVNRINQLGYRDTQATVNGQIIALTVYGNPTQARRAVVGSLDAGRLLVRPVICQAPLYVLEKQPVATHQALECGSQYVLSAKALDVDTATGKARGTITPDPVLATVSTTASEADNEDARVLLPTGDVSGYSGTRLVCGPSRLDDADISSVDAVKDGSGWGLQVSLTSTGSKDFDEVAYAQFHALVANDLDGTVISAPITEPTQSSFQSFNGQFEISAGYTRTQAVQLANDITSPLAVPLQIAG
ncbi:MAG: hypothetical protein WAM97_09070 [Acidimicrobiales bacterium]